MTDAQIIAGLLADFANGIKTGSSEHGGGMEWTVKVGGWGIEIFDDCGQVDYVQEAKAPDGRLIQFTDMKPDPIEILQTTGRADVVALLERRMAADDA